MGGDGTGSGVRSFGKDVFSGVGKGRRPVETDPIVSRPHLLGDTERTNRRSKPPNFSFCFLTFPIKREKSLSPLGYVTVRVDNDSLLFPETTGPTDVGARCGQSRGLTGRVRDLFGRRFRLWS